MPALKTEVTEIVTGLGMLGFPTLEEALAARPLEMINVQASHWNRLDEALANNEFEDEFETAWSNGVAFSQASTGLRNRRPLRIEWKGPNQTPGYDLIPSDLRVDHVYLVSCKSLSRILFNPSPSHLFDRVLADRKGSNRADWYMEAAPDAYRTFYSEVRRHMAGGISLPTHVEDLDKSHREQLKRRLPLIWPPSLRDVYLSFCAAVSQASAERWRSNILTPRAQEEMLWRLLRIASAPYFVLGASGRDVLRLYVYTPWDWRRDFKLRSFSVQADTQAGQPVVRWRALVGLLTDRRETEVEGHAEIRWSHGRFYSNPEAKVYLDTPHTQVPGYQVLE